MSRSRPYRRYTAVAFIIGSVLVCTTVSRLSRYHSRSYPTRYLSKTVKLDPCRALAVPDAGIVPSQQAPPLPSNPGQVKLAGIGIDTGTAVQGPVLLRAPPIDNVASPLVRSIRA